MLGGGTGCGRFLGADPKVSFFEFVNEAGAQQWLKHTGRVPILGWSHRQGARPWVVRSNFFECMAQVQRRLPVGGLGS